MAYTYEEAVAYFENEVLHNTAFIEADPVKRNRALKSAENELYSSFPMFDKATKPLPNTAIYEQAIWLLRKDDTILKGELGITNINLSGEVSLSVSQKDNRIAPNVKNILRMSRKKVGRYS